MNEGPKLYVAGKSSEGDRRARCLSPPCGGF
jgi:hypothetical protein